MFKFPHIYFPSIFKLNNLLTNQSKQLHQLLSQLIYLFSPMQNLALDKQLQGVSNTFLEQIKILETSKQWEKVDDKPCLNYKMEVDGKRISRAQVNINIPYEKVLNFFSDPLYMKKIVEQVDISEILYSTESFNVVYTKMKGFGPVSSREMVVVVTFKKEGNKAYVGNRSCNYPYKGDPDSIRAEAIVAGMILEKVTEGQTKLISISNVDIKGSVPNFIRNWLAEKRAESLVTIEQKIKVHLK